MEINWVVPREQVDTSKPVTVILFTLRRLHVWREIQNTSMEAALERIEDYCRPTEWTGAADILAWVGGTFQTVVKVN